mmetsp:Transcript_2008/g.4237  ORF Transcript_2008/g.4237 Transcript_2008/m.4237 type:complete len:102 (+) Transcript_2008:114-419(+)
MTNMSVEDRLAALEKGAGFQATATEVKKVEAEYLSKLREIRAVMAKQDGNGGASSKEVDQLKEENDKLKAKIAKMEYRINHMTSSMETMYEENKQLKKEKQ